MKSELLRRALMSKMANGGNVGGDDKNKKTEEKPRVRTIGQSGADLTADIIINRDPSKISEKVNYGAWNAFQNYLKKQKIDGEPFVGNPRLNTEEGRKYEQEAIEKWNASDYVKKFPQNKITPEQSLAIQQYHKLSDPSVQTEGWVGSQTSRMRYPEPRVEYEGVTDPKTGMKVILNKEGYVPVMWGNKQYVAPAANVGPGGSISTKSLVPYEPSKYFDLLQKPESGSSVSYQNVYKQFVPQSQETPKPKNYAPNKSVNEPNSLPVIKSETVQAKKMGGVIKKYSNGTDPSGVDPNVVSETNAIGGTKLKDIGGADKLKLLNMVAPMAAGGLDALDRKDDRSSIAGQAGVGAIKGTSTGLQIGMNPALMAATGGLSAPIGAIGGAVIGGTTGAIRGKKEKKERQEVTKQEAYDKAIEAQESTNPNRGAVELESYNAKDYRKGLAGLFAKGGTIKGAGTGTSDSIVTDINKKGIPEGSFITPAKNNEMAKGIRGMVLGDNPNKVAEFKKGGTPKSDKVAVSNGEHLFTPAEKEKIIKYLGKEILEKLAPEAEENEMEKKKGGEMIKRADGSYSKRGLRDNIRANIGSGKKPTAEMLKQEKEIKSELKKGGYVVKRSSERKGKTHVVIGPDGTKKYFGDSNLGQHPNDPARKKAFYARHEKNLKKNPYFRAFARETWAEGGTVGSKMNKEMLEKELIKKANGGNVAVADKTKVKSPNVSSEALKKLKDKQKQIDERGKKYDEEIAKGNTIVVIPNKPTIESKKFKSADSTYFYPNAYVSPTEGYKYTKTEVGGKYKGNVKENPKDVYMSNPNAVIRQDSSEYAGLGYKNGGNVAVTDKTKVKSPNVYEGKMPKKEELVSTLQESRVLKRKDGTSKVEVKMPDGTWKTTYDLQKKAKGGTLTKSKAKEILHDKSVHGKPLTDKQRKYFGWVAGGKKNMGGIVGKYAMGGKVNRDWDWG